MISGYGERRVASIGVRALAGALAGVVLAGVALAGEATATQVEAKPAESWRSGAMVAAANPLAVDAGVAVLKAGGSAVDAAIAVQAVLGLVEPQSSGIGGGAFLVHYKAKTGDGITYDGRGVAPASATPSMLLDESGKPLAFPVAVRSGLSVGVPGLIAMLELAHAEHGKLPWAAPWQSAIRWAEQGFAVSPRLHQSIRYAQGSGGLSPDATAYLTTDGSEPLPVGHRLINREYGATLRQIATEGARGFYQGPIAEAIVAAVRRGDRPGGLALTDLAAYRPQRLEPVCGDYRIYRVCGMRPPSSGGIAVLSILGILNNFDMASMRPEGMAGWHHFIEAQRLAYADRDRYVADDRYESVPLAGLIDSQYLTERSQLIRADRALDKVEAGVPPGATPRGKDATGQENGTSHFVVVDAQGNVVSMTTTVESIFGSQRMAAGFFLNNQLTDFSFRPVDATGAAIANAVAPGKKPRSSMSPTIIFRDGQFELAVGSPGGNAIIAYVSKAIIGMLDWGLSPQESVDLPNVIARGRPVAESRLDPAVLDALSEAGHQFRDARGGGEGSGLHAVRRLPSGELAGAADSRREGKAEALR